MKKSKFSEEQIAYALREVEAGRPQADVCRQLGVSEAAFYAPLGVTELRQLRSLEDENARLKRRVADLSLDKHILTVASPSSVAPLTAVAQEVSQASLQGGKVPDLAFPHDQDIPAALSKRVSVSVVSLHVCLPLGSPEIGACGGGNHSVSAVVHVPVAPVHEDHLSPRREDKVRPTW